MSRRRHTPEQIIGKLRDEFLNGEIFYTLPEAVVLVQQWRRLYNTVPSDHTAPGAVYPPPRRRSNHRLRSLECPSFRDRRWLNV